MFRFSEDIQDGIDAVHACSRASDPAVHRRTSPASPAADLGAGKAKPYPALLRLGDERLEIDHGGDRCALMRRCQAHSCGATERPNDGNLSAMQRSKLSAAQRALVKEMMEAAGVTTYAALAKLAGLATSTIARFMNEKRPSKFLLSSSTLAKLSAATGVAVPSGLVVEPTARSEIDLERLMMALTSAGDGLAGSAEIVARVYNYLVRHPNLRGDTAQIAADAIAEELRIALGRNKAERSTDEH